MSNLYYIGTICFARKDYEGLSEAEKELLKERRSQHAKDLNARRNALKKDIGNLGDDVKFTKDKYGNVVNRNEGESLEDFKKRVYKKGAEGQIDDVRKNAADDRKQIMKARNITVGAAGAVGAAAGAGLGALAGKAFIKEGDDEATKKRKKRIGALVGGLAAGAGTALIAAKKSSLARPGKSDTSNKSNDSKK